jgi:biotin-dependent carboxylase-like uncharacterized protein
VIEVLTSGLLNTVQDLGRHQSRNVGVAVAGAMDKLALSAGNRLLGNASNAAAIEVMMFPFAIRFMVTTKLAITGADTMATLDGEPILPWWTITARTGQILRLNPPLVGAIAYVIVGGGIDVPVVLDSRSTDLKIGFGGFEGRPLRKGDRVPTGITPRTWIDWAAGYGVECPDVALQLGSTGDRSVGVTQLRVLPAGEYEKFPEDVRELYWHSRWRISPNSNRSAYRLSGPTLQATGHSDVMYSHGIVPGIIQVPPAGQPIVQMADANTHGGYPKIGTVIEADMWRLAQAKLGTFLQFVQVSYDDAVTALALEREYVQAITHALEHEEAV